MCSVLCRQKVRKVCSEETYMFVTDPKIVLQEEFNKPSID